ncbi:MAG: hypothetical protein IPM66_01530 [Acidobacteriota bacterium]|nr:MAG: hypothetical protein IPM66_01530 [Acidobacteriota bacterium]
MFDSISYLLRHLDTKPSNLSRESRVAFYLLALNGLLAVLILTSIDGWSGLAAYRKAQALTLQKLPALDVKGPLLSAGNDNIIAAPQQGCMLECTATVPETDGVGVSISFQSTATATSCFSQPVFDWNFGDGTPHSNQQNPNHTYSTAGTYTWTLTTSVNSGSTLIDTVAGGFGEGNPIRQSPFGDMSAIARDPQGRGIYVADNVSGQSIIRFLNLSDSPVTLAGITIEPGTVRQIAGGGLDLGENIPALAADIGQVTGLGVSAAGDILFYANKIDGLVAGLNISTGNVTIAGAAIAPGRIGTLAANFDTDLNGLAVRQSTGVVYVTDATAGVNKVYSVALDGTRTVVAGNGAGTSTAEPFVAGPATSIPLLLPRAIQFDAAGDLLISDTGHARVIRVDGGGNATLVHQYVVSQANPNPYPSGLAVQNGNVYTANGNQQTITRVTGGVMNVAGIVREFCDYSISNCGDGGPGTMAGLNLAGSTASPPLAGIAADANGIFILDQGQIGRGRVRYLNLTGGSVSVGGVNIPAGAIETIAGNGLSTPYDGGLATGAAFNTPVGVAVDANGNLWIADTLSARIRFANRGASSITIFAGTAAEQVVPAGTIVTVNKDVGAGATDGVPVNQAAFDSPQGLWVTSQGLFVADSKNGPAVPPQTINNKRSSLIRYINTTSSTVTIYPGSGTPIDVPAGHIAKIAGGNPNEGPNGDGGFALNARFIGATDVVVTSNGTIYVTDAGQKAVRKIDGATGTVSSLGLAQATYTGVGLDGTGRLYIANYEGNSVLRETSAGSGNFAVLATNLTKPRDVAVGADGTSYVTVAPAAQQNGNHQIVQITSGGAVSVISGSTAGFGGDGGAATAAQLNINPSDLNAGSGTPFLVPQTVNITVGSSGEIFFTDSNNNRVRRLSPSMVMCVKTGTITIGGNNPLPTLTSLDPNTALQDSGAFTLTVNGTNFVPSSVVRWNGQDRTTTYVNSTQLTASILATDISNPGNASVTVFTPVPGGGTSNALTFTITAPNPAPTLTSLSPNSAIDGSPAFELTVNGTGFVDGASVRWDGQARMTTFVSANQLKAQILATDVQGVGKASVTVFNPPPGGGTSGVLEFDVLPQTSPAPTLTSMNPSSISAGGPGFTLTVTGTNFVGSSKVRWNGTDRLTTVVSSTQMTAEILETDIATAGTAQVTVFTPAPGGGVTAPLTFTIIAPNPVPTIAGLSPSSAIEGGAAFELTVNGTGFVDGAVVRWNGQDRTTTFVSATQLKAAIPAADILTAGTAQVTVFTPAPGGGGSNALTFTIVVPNPVPTIASLSPSSAIEGGAAFELTVNGTGFVDGAVVRWNGQDRTTTFVSATQLKAAIPAADIATAGTAQVTVFNPAPGGGGLNALTFTIIAPNPVPTIASLSPNSAIEGGAAFELTVNGTGFVDGAVVRWNGQDRTTTFVSATQLKAAIPAGDIATAGTAQVTVFNPAPGGGASNALTFTIVAPNPTPAIASLSPNSAIEGGAAFELTVNGTGFVDGAVVRWNGQDRTTTFVSATQLKAAIPAADIATAGTAQVTVFTPAPGGGASNALTFTIVVPNPVPVLTSLSPNSTIQNGPPFSLTVNGTGFVEGAVVKWNGQDRTTTFVSSTQLIGTIAAADIAAAGTVQVTVFNPAPGGGASNALTFTIIEPNPVPTLAGLSPASASAGGPGFTLTVTGTNFISGSKVQWNGSDRPTTFINSTRMTAEISASDIMTAGTAQVTVFTPAPGGGASNPQSFTIIPLVTVSAASYLASGIAPEAIVAGFGVNLASGIAVADTVPLPTSLLGTSVKVKDSQGVERDAPLFFVAPGQINYLVPQGTAQGDAMITVVTNGVTAATGTMTVNQVGPGLISANSNGFGVAAAVVLRVASNGAQTFEPVSTFDQGSGTFVPVEIDLGPEGDQIYLILYGTGFRGNSGLDEVTVDIDGVSVPVLYASGAPDFIGLDQANLGPLSRTLIGRKLVNIVMTVNGVSANVVQISIK